MALSEILVVAMLASFVLLLFSGFPVAWALGGVAVLFTAIGWLADTYFDALTGLDYGTFGLAVGRIFAVMDNWVLVAVPLFILMGQTLERAGVAEGMMDSLQQLFGRLRGGLALSVTLIGVILAAATGIVGASVTLLGVLALPLMLRQGYRPSLAVGTVAGAGCLGILIPPSIMLVIMGDQLSLPVGDLFMGALLPGLLLALLYGLYILWRGWREPDAAPPPAGGGRVDLALLGRLLHDLLPAALLILGVLGSIFAGIATVTEAAGVGAAGALLLAWLKGRLDRATLRGILDQSLLTTSYIMAILVAATVFSLVLRELGGDELIESLFSGLDLPPYALLAVILAVVFALGFVLDWIEITLIVLPLLAPVVSGLDLAIPGYGVVEQPALVWFALLVAIALQTSFLTPPVGFALFYLKGVCPPAVGSADLYRGVLPFIALQLLALVLVAGFPALVTWLPAVTYSP
jgi:tripartite ATP-independent transporter DctM subunit